ncbi:MAG TPA: cytochrome c oxidase assembly protein [Solirubrobacteraceae bacterium]|nr:cytochrome c oxidase assembly protein [Solirubrobacteraceae bacterium]
MAPPLIWTFEPSVLVGVSALTVAYVWAWRRARRPGMPHPPGLGRLTLFALSMLCILVALVSPVDTLSTDVLFAHMVQHLLLLDLMPILLILSLTKGLMRPVTRRIIIIEQRARVLSHPVFAVCMYVGMMALWHVPAMYDLAVAHPPVHVLEHLCFSVAGTLYWWHLLSPIQGRQRLTGMQAAVYMAVTKFFVGMLGIFLIFAPHCIYPWYQDHPQYWGLTARDDQSLAGVLMALEQSLIMGIALTYLVFKALTDKDARENRGESYDAAMATYRTALAAAREQQRRG